VIQYEYEERTVEGECERLSVLMDALCFQERNLSRFIESLTEVNRPAHQKAVQRAKEAISSLQAVIDDCLNDLWNIAAIESYSVDRQTRAERRSK